MRIGFSVPQFGAFADPDLVLGLSRALEDMGYDSLWVGDRILGPITPSDPYPGGDGTMPQQYATHLDPLLALTLAATVTERVRLGSSTLNALWQPPVLLARTLTTLDLVSHGRLDVGIGLGWMRDEYTAVGVEWAGRGNRLEETLDLLEAVWTSQTVEHQGELWSVPASRIFPKPVQRPHPPILLGGFSPAGLERVGRRGNGWLAAAMPLPYLTGLWSQALRAAEQAGREPSQLRLVVRANPTITSSPADPAETFARGTVGQICDYLRSAVEAGADEVFVDPQLTTSSPDEFLDLAQEFITNLRTG
ncbi:TIGR03619 family F420-dependent LLM class oxidoreductase [Streptomyces sp. NPDC059002]|uniref:TIGR03619 family F420-dependent LLM class oxidoreductase n=1 Tax=Streptomyces sp. NPDC059002 TaxID=3346690 RepID=UPI0036B5C833